jgi:flagellar assembly protein FliH
LSKVIKIHTPGGQVRTLGRGGRKRGSHPFAVFVEELRSVAQDDRNDRGNHAGAKAVKNNIEQQLKDEFKAGFEEGRRFAEKQMREEIAGTVAASKAAVDTLTSNVLLEYRRLQAEAERNVVKLAMAIAERIVKRELTLDNSVVLRQIQEATKRVIGVERIRIRVNPQDEEYVREHRTQVLTAADAVRELVIESDETIGRGGCVLESDTGNVDALIATQMKSIETAILGQPDDQ